MNYHCKLKLQVISYSFWGFACARASSRSFRIWWKIFLLSSSLVADFQEDIDPADAVFSHRLSGYSSASTSKNSKQLNSSRNEIGAASTSSPTSSEEEKDEEDYELGEDEDDDDDADGLNEDEDDDEEHLGPALGLRFDFKTAPPLVVSVSQLMNLSFR